MVSCLSLVIIFNLDNLTFCLFSKKQQSLILQGSLKTLKQEGSLYETDQEEDEIRWLGDVTMHREVPAGKNVFLQKLESEEKTSFDITDQDVTDKGTPRFQVNTVGNGKNLDWSKLKVFPDNKMNVT